MQLPSLATGYSSDGHVHSPEINEGFRREAGEGLWTRTRGDKRDLGQGQGVLALHCHRAGLDTEVLD